MKSILTKVLVTAMLLVTLICSILPANAANICSQISGGNKNTVTFTVTTDSTWLTSNTITLSGTKGTIEYSGGINQKTGRESKYGHFDITVTASGYKKTYRMTSGSYKIPLHKKNTTFTITVEPVSVGTMNSREFGLVSIILMKNYTKWIKNPGWNVRKTSGLTLCQ